MTVRDQEAIVSLKKKKKNAIAPAWVARIPYGIQTPLWLLLVKFLKVQFQ